MDFDSDRFKKISETFSSKNVLVIGDVMLDSYLWGRADRISSEAPVPIIQVESSNNNPGGAGNVAMNIKALKGNVKIIGLIGDDINGDKIIQLLEDGEIDVSGLVRDPARITSVKTRVISQNQQVVRVDQESTSEISKDIQETVLKNIEDSILENDAVILADYNKGLFSNPLINAIIDISNLNKIPVYVDPKKNHFSEFKNSRLFKPNLKEFQQAIGSDYKSEKFIKQGIDFRSRISAEIVLITLGPDGISLFTEDGHISIPTKARKVHDVSGAGDTVISTFVLADLGGATLVESATLANLAAGRVCEEVGVIPITLSKLANIIQSR